MADTPEIDILALHDAIKAALAAQFPGAAVDCYGRPGEKTPTPAIYFELESVEPSDPSDVGTEQFDAILRFSAYCVLSFKKTADQVKAKLAARALAASVLRFVRGQRWGSPVSQAVCLGAFPDTFEQPIDQYEVQRVEWEHRGFIGDSAWDVAGVLPTELYVEEPEEARLDGTQLPVEQPEDDAPLGGPISQL
jgi:hypothetical protein